MSLREQLLDYWDSLWKDIPTYVWEAEAGVLIVVTIVLLLWKGWNRGIRWSLGLLLLEYVMIIYCSTVIFRATSVLFSGYDLHPFWSYRAYFSGEAPRLLVENVMNVVVFVPVGVLLGVMVNGSRLMVKKEWLIPLVVGLCISVSIEVMQFVLKRGFCEVDDVMHNTAGCVIGYGMYLMARGALHKIWR